ncbi:MAG: hypothetical protein ACI3ZN_07480, partial [Candidatus Cryptobacteroides sp.]
MTEHSGKNEAFVFSPELLGRINVGMWALEVVDGQKPRMYADPVMARLLGCSADLDSEEIYEFWSKGVDEEAGMLLNNNLQRMSRGMISEVQYFWTHPDGSRRIIRCGGTRDWSFKDGIRCEGTHRDITELSHIDDEWRRRSVMLKSYFNYYNSKDALVILLVNLQNDHYATIKSSKEIEARMPLNDEGSFSEYITKFVGIFATENQFEKVLTFSNYSFLDNYFANAPVYRQHFSTTDEQGNTKWYRLTANRLNNNDMVVSLEDRTVRIAEDIMMKTISNRLVGGFILNTALDSVSVVKLTPFFNYLDDNTEPLTIRLGVELLCPHMDAEFREGWLHFASMENLMFVFNNQKRSDYPFKAIFAGEHTWLRASLYAVDRKMS